MILVELLNLVIDFIKILKEWWLFTIFLFKLINKIGVPTKFKII